MCVCACAFFWFCLRQRGEGGRRMCVSVCTCEGESMCVCVTVTWGTRKVFFLGCFDLFKFYRYRSDLTVSYHCSYLTVSHTTVVI